MTILEKLKKLNGRSFPMHMPGHKRQARTGYLRDLCAKLDITEIDGFDDLHNPHGIISEAQKNAASLWGAEESAFLVGGSTLGILAGIYSHVKRGDRVILARNCHKSVYHALELCGAVPEFIVPKTDKKTGICLSIDPRVVEKALAKFPDAKLVILTSPTYEGVISNIKSIATAVHKHGIPLLVDEAHGSHLGFNSHFSGGAVRAGADIVVQSLHKTLPSLTQTAIVHMSGLCNKSALRRALGIFETSSPSYLLLASIDGCVNYVKTHTAGFSKWAESLAYFERKAKSLKNLSIFRADGAFGIDPSKIVISTAACSINGFELMTILRDRYRIELEMASTSYAIAMTGMFDGRKSLGRLARALSRIDRKLSPAPEKVFKAATLPERAFTVHEALEMESNAVSSDTAAGSVSAEYVWAYPPGVPIILPGEVFSADVIAKIDSLKSAGANMIMSDSSAKSFKVLAPAAKK